MIVVDASVLIAHLSASDPHHARAAALLSDAVRLPLATSPITVAEVLVGPARIGRLDDARQALGTLEVREVRLGPDAGPRLATLRATTSLKLPECCVLLAAQDARATRLLSFDHRLAAAAGRLGFSTT